MYSVESYRTQQRFNDQYKEISEFLRITADHGFNEHFHWGRFYWMMAHPDLDIEALPKIAIFRDNNKGIVGIAIFDTCYQNRWYIIHSVSDEILLRQLMEYVNRYDDTPIIKANLRDISLCKLLEDIKYKSRYSESILTMNLSHDLYYRLPAGFCINEPHVQIDKRQWRFVIHRGFDNDGIPQIHGKNTAKAEERLLIKEYIKTFAMKDGDYVAHCGVWYDGGETAYIEPVATVPECRRKGLGRAVVYEALNRAKNRGAKRAVVISEQDFYKNIGMEKSSEVYSFVK